MKKFCAIITLFSFLSTTSIATTVPADVLNTAKLNVGIHALHLGALLNVPAKSVIIMNTREKLRRAISILQKLEAQKV